MLGKLLRWMFLLITGFLIISVLFVNLIIGTKADAVEGITVSKIKQVKPGMTLEQLNSILGKPFKIAAGHGLHNNNCKNPKPMLNDDILPETDIRLVINKYLKPKYYCCDGNKEDIQLHPEIILSYTRPVKFVKSYPMLNILLDSTTVNTIWVELYQGTLGFDNYNKILLYGTSSNPEIRNFLPKNESKIDSLEKKLEAAFN